MDEEISNSDSDDSMAWMTTFADLMTLLLVFFVLLWTFAKMDVGKFIDAMSSIQSALGAQNPAIDQLKYAGSLDAKSQSASTTPEVDYDQLYNQVIANELMTTMGQMGILDAVDVDIELRGIVVRVKGQLLFNSGTADLKTESFQVLDEIAKIFEKSPDMKMSIEGHTDNIAIHTKKFSSNWELSTERAFSAFSYIKNNLGIDDRRIKYIAGFADKQPRETNNTPEGRAKNRRVEFVFSKS